MNGWAPGSRRRWEAEVPVGSDTRSDQRGPFLSRLIRSLRKRLGITQDELATLAGVTVGAVHQWEMGKFQPRDDKKGVLVALRGHGRREVQRLLEEARGKVESSPEKVKKVSAPAKKARKK